ncbi:hypothetical protein [Streptomyces fradiae]|uniref:hypothetical protein n=1 Tax=Streptomyces fradiae TaxID=1906 RepID=UPI0035184031
MRITRRTLRTAAVATGTIAALTLPAAAAFADDQPAPNPDNQSQDQGQDQDSADPVVGRIFVQSYKLADGSVAKVYMTTPNDYQAEIWAGGTLLDTLTTSGQPAYGQNNGLHVVLQPDGSVSSWMDEAPTPKPTPTPTPKPTPKPKPKPAPHTHANARVTLPDGSVAKFYKKSNRVELRFGTLTPKKPTLSHHGWTFKLAPQPGKGVYRLVVIDTPKQGGNSWVYDFDGKLVRKYTAQKSNPQKTSPQKTGTVVVPRGTVPQGAVKAGAENVPEVSHDTHQAALIGAGGGMAALGAAGLGFALYHRRGSGQES